MTTSPTVGEYLATELARRGVTHVFELVGGMVVALLDHLHQQPDVHVVSMRHEQGAGFAAEGWARVTGVPAVALATSGPGATNLLTAVASCYFDSVPAVFITGQVKRAERSVPGRGRQAGFQETDIVSMAAPVTKAALSAESGHDFPRVLNEAFAIALSGRPGPVLLDIPLDVQLEEVGSPAASGVMSRGESPPDARHAFAADLRAALATSERPLLLVGGGVRAGGAVDVLRSVLPHLGIPVVHSLLGLDVVPTESPLRVGMIGSYGNRWANWAVAHADTLVVLGSRLDGRQTGSDVAGFARGRRILQVDVDAGEIDARVPVRGLVDDLAVYLRDGGLDGIRMRSEWAAWRDAIDHQRRQHPDTSENIPVQGLNPNELLVAAQQAWPDVAAWVTDVGQHQMWFAQSARPLRHQRILTSGGLGAMGFGLPAAIGACLATGAPVALVAGDGGFQLNLQELQVVAHHGLPLRMLVLNNGSHGMVRQFQSSYFGRRHGSSVDGYSAPSFTAVAKAFGIPALGVTAESQVGAALTWASDQPGPALLDIAIDPQLDVMPKLAYGREFGAMEPHVTPVSFGAELAGE